jgi:hypothetical protein
MDLHHSRDKDFYLILVFQKLPVSSKKVATGTIPRGVGYFVILPQLIRVYFVFK